MDTLFMNSNISKISDPHSLKLHPIDKINLKRNDKYVVLWNPYIYYTWKKIKKSYKNNTFKILVPTRNDRFELLD